MPLLYVILVIVVVGVVLWAVTTYVPMAPPIKQILTAVVVLALVLWLLSAFGIIPGVVAVRPR